MPIETKSKELMKAMSSKMVQAAFVNGNYEKVYALLGVKAEEIVQDGFATGGFGKWPALESSTIARKGSSGILIDTAELRKSVTSDVVRKSSL
ncbi:MAG: hypothetical protein COB09_19175 [Thalassobium sp.]|nr:MAG: hypothetical protein COB09_19175 [Thalassobium sp.]